MNPHLENMKKRVYSLYLFKSENSSETYICTRIGVHITLNVPRLHYNTKNMIKMRKNNCYNSRN